MEAEHGFRQGSGKGRSSNLGLLHVLEAMQPSFPVLGGVGVGVERY